MRVLPGLLGIAVGGWLAQQLASTDGDLDAAIAAYDAGDHDGALTALEQVKARRGELPVLAFDEGLFRLAKGEREAALPLFELASESDDPRVRGAANYELGNLAFDDEQWEAAISAYTQSLRARPDHEPSKWNLELALARKEAADKEQEQEQEQDEQDEGDEQGEAQDQDGEQEQDEGDEQDEEQEQDGEQEQDEGDNQDGDEDPTQEEENASGEGQEGEEQAQDDPPPNEDGDAPPESPEQENAPAPQGDGDGAPPPQQVDASDIGKTLEQLDNADDFSFGRVRGGRRRVAKDW